MTTYPVEVMVDTAASAAEVEAISAALSDVGIDNRTEASARMQGDGPWMILLVMLAAPFLSGFTGEAGKDGWKALKRLVANLHEARGCERWGQLVIRPGVIDEAQAQAEGKLLGFPIPGNPNVELTIATGIPDEAYQALCDLDLGAFDGGTLHWNEQAGEWVQYGGLADQ